MKRGVIVVAALATALGVHVGHAAPGAKPTAPEPALPMLPSVSRIKVVVGKAQIIVVEDVALPRGEWRGEALDLYVAFGAPGAPRAIDAHLLPVADGALEPPEDAAGEALQTDRAPRRPPSVHPLLGRDTMAGIVVHVTKDALTKALAPGGMAALRLRTAIDLPPEEEAAGARSVVVRLGASRGTPLTLGRVVVTHAAGAAPVTSAEARLCGPEADGHPLAVHLRPRAADAKPSEPRIAPVLAVRHPTDDLCLRFWRGPGAAAAQRSEPTGSPTPLEAPAMKKRMPTPIIIAG